MSVRKRGWTTAKGDAREAWIVDYVDQSGVRRLKTFHRKRDATNCAATTSVEVRTGVHVPDSATVTINEAGAKWLEACAADELERSTIEAYRQHLELHIAPYIGRVKLSQLGVQAVRDLQDRLRAAGRSPAMVKRVTVSLGSLLADAHERGLSAHNPVRDMSRKRRKGGRSTAERHKARLEVGVHIPTPLEIRAIVEAAKGRWRPFLITAIFTGTRASELRGLRWFDVDLKARRLNVRQRADAYHNIGMPKSAAGQRAIPVPPIVVSALREWKLQCPKGELNLVFPTGAGNVESHANIVKRGFWPTQVTAGVTSDYGDAKYPGLHSLRHFYASWCITPKSAGGLELPGKIVQVRLGHSTITMTMDVYGHLFPESDDGASLAQAEQALMSAVSAS